MIVCKNCGREIENPTGRRTFCSDQCRQQWWYSNRSAHPTDHLFTKVCEYCGKEYTVYGTNNRKYCSPDCAAKARFGTKEERACKRQAVQAGDEIPDMCLHCKYFIQAKSSDAR